MNPSPSTAPSRAGSAAFLSPATAASDFTSFAATRAGSATDCWCGFAAAATHRVAGRDAGGQHPGERRAVAQVVGQRGRRPFHGSRLASTAAASVRTSASASASQCLQAL